MLSLKSSVRWGSGGPHPALLFGLLVAEQVLEKEGIPLIVTAGANGRHKRASSHWRGTGADFRSRHIDASDSYKYGIASDISDKLTQEYTCVFEPRIPDDNGGIKREEHFHLHWEPLEP